MKSAIQYASVLVFAALCGCSTPPIQFGFDSTVPIEETDLGAIVDAINSISVESLEADLNQGAFTTLMGGKRVLLTLGKDVTLSSNNTELRRADGDETTAIALSIIQADIKIDGELTVAVDELPPIAMTELKINLESEASAHAEGEGTVQARLVVKEILSALITHIVGCPAASAASSDASLGQLVRSGSVRRINVTLREGAQLAVTESLSGIVASGSHLSLQETSFTLANETTSMNTGVTLRLKLEKNAEVRFEEFAVIAKTLDFTVGGTLNHDGSRTTFKRDPKSEGVMLLGEATVSKLSKSGVEAEFRAESLRVVCDTLTVVDDPQLPQMLVDSTFNVTGRFSGDLRQPDATVRRLAVDSVEVTDLVLTNDSKTPKQTAKTAKPIIISGATVMHSGDGGSVRVTVPNVQLAGLAEQSPSAIEIDVHSLVAHANQIVVIQGDNEIIAEFGEDFHVESTGGRIRLSGNEQVGIWTVAGKGTVARLSLKSGKQLLNANDVSLDLSVACDRKITVSGAATGCISVESSDFSFQGATVSVDSSSLEFDEQGGIKNGQLLVKAELPAATLAEIIRKKIPPEFEIPKKDIRFKVTETIQEEVVEKISIGGDAGKLLKNAFKEVTKLVDRVVDTEVKTAFENGRVRTNVEHVGFSQNRFSVSGKPSVSGKVTGKFGFEVAATFRLSADATLEFNQPKKLQDLKLIAPMHYKEVNIELNNAIKDVPGAAELRDALVAALTGGRGLKLFLPERIEHGLFHAKAVAENQELTRIVNPRISSRENDGVVVLEIAATIE